MKLSLQIWLLVGWVLSASGYAVQVVSDRSEPECETLPLSHELTIYKDPTMFLPVLARLREGYAESLSELLNEGPVLTTRSTEVSLMRLTQPSAFRNFGYISKIYGMKEPRLDKQEEGEVTEIIHIRLCGNDPYSDSLGFVLVSDLKRASEPAQGSRRPPSVGRAIN